MASNLDIHVAVQVELVVKALEVEHPDLRTLVVRGNSYLLALRAAGEVAALQFLLPLDYCLRSPGPCNSGRVGSGGSWDSSTLPASGSYFDDGKNLVNRESSPGDRKHSHPQQPVPVDSLVCPEVAASEQAAGDLVTGLVSLPQLVSVGKS